MSKRIQSIICVILLLSMIISPTTANVFSLEETESKISKHILAQHEKFIREQEEQQNKKEVHDKFSKENMKDESSESVNQELGKRRPIFDEGPEDIKGEIISHDEDSITYKLSETEYITRIGSQSLFYKDNNGKEKEINNDLKEGSKTYENKSNYYDLILPKKGEAVEIKGGGYTFTLSPVFASLENGVREKNAIRYNDVADGIDIQYTAFSDSVKEDIILMKPSKLKNFRYEIKANKSGDTLLYKIEDNRLKIYERNGEKDQLVYSVSAPYMTDNNGDACNGIVLNVTKKDGKVYLDITPNEKWLNAPERAYPVRIDPTISLTRENMEFGVIENGSGGGGAAGSHIEHLGNSYLYAGYEDGSLVGISDIRYQQTRSYIKFDYNFSKIPKEAIVTAKVQLYEYAGSPGSDSYVDMKMIASKWRGTKKSWDTQPTTLVDISNGQSVQSHGWKTFNISTAVREWINGAPNLGLMITPRKESQPACCFSGPDNRHGEHKMYLDLYWTVPNPVDENMPLEPPSINLRPFSKQKDAQITFTGLTADGIVRPQLDVNYALKESDTGKVILEDEFKKADWGKKYPNSDLVKEDISFTTGYTGLHEANWQSVAMKRKLMQSITPYKVSATANRDHEKTPEGKSDEFIIYEFTKKDTFPYVASFYGVTTEQLIKDNRPTDYLGCEGNSIFIRNPKYNRKKAYIREAKLSDSSDHYWDIAFANLGRGRCTDFDLEPVNTASGNFCYDTVDANNTDYIDTFELKRTYNSIGDKSRGLFGYGWTSEIEKSIVRTKDGFIYDKGDGSRYKFSKTEDNKYESVHYPYAELRVNKEKDHPEKTTYILTDEKEKNTYKFNAFGNLASIQDIRGLETRILYSTEKFTIKDTELGEGEKSEDKEVELPGKIQSVITKSGKTYNFTLDNEGRLTCVTLPTGVKLKYEYTDDCLTAFINADGDRTTYTYDKNALMTSWSDGEGNVQVKNTYDVYGRVIKQIDANGGISTVSYGKDSNIVTDAGGNKKTYYHDNQLRTTKMSASDDSEVKKWNNKNELTYVKDGEGNTTKYSYDEKGNILSETRFDGKVKSYIYDEYNNPIHITDFNGNEVERRYNRYGDLLLEKYADGTSVRYTYDNYGREISYTDENGSTSTASYDGTSKASINDISGNTSILYYDGMGRLVNTIDQEGIEHKNIYTADGKKAGTWVTGNFSENYAYDHAGNCVRITDGEGNISTAVYDGMGKMISLTDGDGNTSTYIYDKVGNLISEKDGSGIKITRTYDANGHMTSETKGGHKTTYSYDSLGRLEKKVNPLGGTYTYSYEGDTENIVKETGENGIVTRAYDGEGNLIQEDSENSGKTVYTRNKRYRVVKKNSPTGLITEYSLDKKGDVLTEKDSNGREYQYTYDKAGNLVSVKSPVGNVTTYSYDKIGRVISITDAEGHVTGYSYDGMNNLLSVSNADGTKITYEYDHNSNNTKITDENGAATEYRYTALNLVKLEKDAIGNTTLFKYDGAGKLLTEEDKNGNSESYIYNEVGGISRFTDKEGEEYTSETDAEGNITKFKTPEGNEVHSEYDEYGRKVKETDSKGYVKEYEYNRAGQLIGTKDNAGNANKYKYDKAGNLVSETDAAGRTHEIKFDEYGNVLKDKSMDNDVTTYSYDDDNNVLSMTENDGSKTAYTYDKIGNVITKTLPGERKYRYTYDVAGRVLTEINPLNEEARYKYDAAGNLLVTEYADGNKEKSSYDALGREITFENKEGNVVKSSYDGMGNITGFTDAEGHTSSYLYNRRGDIFKEKDNRGAVTEYVYDKDGNLAKKIYPRGGTEEYKYDVQGNLLTEKNRSGATTTYDYEPDGKVKSITLDNGYKTAYSYDLAGRLKSAKSSEGASKIFTYDEDGNISRMQEETGNVLNLTYDKLHRTKKIVNSKGATLLYDYDAAGNNTKITYPEGGSMSYVYDKLGRVTSEKETSIAKKGYTYDLSGNLVRELQKEKDTRYKYNKTGDLTEEISVTGTTTGYSYDKNSNITSIVDPLGRKTSFSYDESGNIVKVADAKGKETVYTYDEENNLITKTNSLNEKTTYMYDKAGRLIHVSDALERTVSYRYDSMDNLIKRTDGSGTETTYAYDKSGNLVKEKSPMGRITKFKYDVAGQLTAKINPDGSKIKYDYDVLGNLISKKYSDGTKSSVYGYDKSGNLINMTDESGKTKRTYDSIGRLKTNIDAHGKKLTYGYDEYDRISSIDYPDKRKVSYVYDADGNITEINDSKGIDATYKYDKAGNILSCTRSDGTKTTYTYDENDNLIKLKNIKGKKILSRYEYSYDSENKVIEEKSRKHGEKAKIAKFTYDKGGQLIGYQVESGGKKTKTTYVYDAQGNKTAISKSEDGIIKAKYNLDNQVISETNSKTGEKIKYKYDKNGNLIKKTSNKKNAVVYEYDIENRLRAVTENKQLLMAATYDGEDNKVFQMSRKLYDGGKSQDTAIKEKTSKTVKEKKKTEGGKYFDADIFMLGFLQGTVSSSSEMMPSLLSYIGQPLKRVWTGITTFATGGYEEVSKDIEKYEDIVVPGTERGTLVTYDLTYYLNDVLFNDNDQVVYQYDKSGSGKASYTYANNTRVAGELKKSAVKYVSETAGDYSYLYDGLGNVVQDAKNGDISGAMSMIHSELSFLVQKSMMCSSQAMEKNIKRRQVCNT